jgi:hemerythrin-like metal-binding protein
MNPAPEPLAWNDVFSVGIEEIDRDHKNLIGMISRLQTTSPVTTDSETISDLLTQMTTYAQGHFETEEALMRRYGYPGFDAHRAEHRVFTKKTVEFCSASMLKVESVPQTLLNFLSEWLVHHILESDQAYAAYIQQHPEE